MIEYSITNKADFLEVSINGEWEISALINILEIIRKQADAGGHKRILIDLFNISTPSSNFDRFRMGEAFARLMPAPMKVVVLLQEERIDHFGEDTAVNRGVLGWATSDKDQAIEWLLKK